MKILEDRNIAYTTNSVMMMALLVSLIYFPSQMIKVVAIENEGLDTATVAAISFTTNSCISGNNDTS